MPATVKIRNADLVKFDLVKRLVVEDIAKHYTLSQLSTQSGLNEFKLKVGFKLLYGVSIYRFLQDQRMKRAISLLARTEDSIQEIAEKCGYGYATNFIAVFRKRFKITPFQYRRIEEINSKLLGHKEKTCFTDAFTGTFHLQPTYWYKRTV